MGSHRLISTTVGSKNELLVPVGSKNDLEVSRKSGSWWGVTGSRDARKEIAGICWRECRCC